jgi:KDO2-lipid IV(A) lauroyltransferase
VAARVTAAPIARRHRPLVVRRARRLLRQLRDALLAVLILAIAGLFALLPLAAALAVASVVGARVAPWLGRAWRLADTHLALAFPEMPREQRAPIARAAFANLGRSFAEIAKFGAVRRRLHAYVHAEGIEHLWAALAGGKGLLAITGHIGNWELLAAYCALAGLPVDVIGRRLHSPLLNHILVRSRARAGVTTILRDSRASSRAILSTLRSNRILALLIDQDTRGPRAFVPFFGRLAATPSGVATLALRTGAPVLAIFISRRSGGGHVIRVHPPFPPADPARDTAESLTAAYTATIEEHVRRHPEEWVWWHRRWRHRPAEPVASSQRLKLY